MSRKKKEDEFKAEPNIFLEEIRYTNKHGVTTVRQVHCLSKQWPDGERIRRRMPLDEARKLLKAIEGAIEWGTWRELKKQLEGKKNSGANADPHMTIEAFADVYYNEYCLSKHKDDNETLAFKSQHLRRIKEFCGKKKLISFTMDDGEEFKRHRQATVSNNTAMKSMAVLSNMFTFAVKTKKLLTANPVKGFERLKIVERARQDMEPEQARAILEEAFKRDPLVGAYIGICAEEGLRPWKEGRNLKRALIDMRPRVSPEDERWLTLEPSKHDAKVRKLPLSDEAIEYARALPAVIGSEYLFARPETGKPPSKKYIVRVLFEAEKAVGVTWPRMHDFRCFRATTWMTNGAPPINVQQWLRHKHIKTTMKYAKPVNDNQNFMDAKRKELERLDGWKRRDEGGDNLATG